MDDSENGQNVGMNTAQRTPRNTTPLSTAQGEKESKDEPFAYESLAAGRIRLIRILAQTDLRIRCELVEVEMSSPGPYYALSYVWGKADARHEILLNNRFKMITPSLLAALTAIRNCQDRGEEEMLIWIDALSINQDCASEKSEQIPLMGRIYSEARTVLIWLTDAPSNLEVVYETLFWTSALDQIDGQSNMELEGTYSSQNSQRSVIPPNDIDMTHGDSKEFASSILRLGSHYGIDSRNLIALKELVVSITELRQRENHRLLAEDVKMILEHRNRRRDLLPQHNPFWLSLFMFMHHEWFRRVWTYQELMLAKHAQILFEDGRLIEWSFVHDCRRALLNEVVYHELFDLGCRIVLENTLGRGATVDEGLEAQFLSWSHEARNLGWLLITSRNRQTTVPKDHVYGLLGLANESTRVEITVSYSNPDAVVFAQAVKAIIKTNPRALPYLWEKFVNQPALEGLPSWTPDFSTTSDERGLQQWNKGCLQPEVSVKWSQFLRFEDGGDLGTIGFLGIRLSKIDNCTSKCPSFDAVRTWPRLDSDRFKDSPIEALGDCFRPDHVEWVLSLLNAFSEDDHSNACFKEGLAAFLLPPAWRCEDAFSTFWASCDLLRQHEQSDGSKLNESFERDLGMDPEDLASVVWQICGLLNRFHELQVLRTSSGHYGSCLRQVRPGDQLIFVPGGSNSHVLSANCDRYVGCAGVPGLLEEALPESPEDLVADRLEMFWVS